MARFVAFISTACLIFLLITIIVYLRFFGQAAAQRVLDSPGVVKEIRELNELITVKYSIEKVVGLKEQKSPVGSESILLLVRGKVLAGIDLSGLNSDAVTINRDRVLIHLMPPHIEDVYLDEQYSKVWDRSITWWTPWVTPDADLEHKARMQAIEDIKTAALEMGILSDARRNAETDISSILQRLGTKKVVFNYGI
jgi:hypothetical protein